MHLLSADVITRYLRLFGEEAISVTGSDAHGTPILIAAENEGTTPQEFCEKKHEEILDILQQWNIKFDNYTITTTQHHKEFIQKFYKDLFANGYVEIKDNDQFYCERCDLFLADRFVEGQCPHCEELDSRGDQCANKKCNEILTPFELINPRCFRCATKPEQKNTRHWYFKLNEFKETLIQLNKTGLKIPKAAQNEVLSFIAHGLNSRALTRDLRWGIPAEPAFQGAQNKVFYVWSEDVLGYVSASIPVIEKIWQKSWQEVWTDRNTRSIYCLGKDNVFFHAVWFPALLSAASIPYQLPYALCTTHHIQFEGQAFSKSKGIGIWADDALKIAAADYWRYYIIKHRPENKDSNFTWDEFITTINKDLADIIGNFTLRLVTLLQKYNNSKVPHLEQIQDTRNKELQDYTNNKVNEIKQIIFDFQLKKGLESTLILARKINEYFTHREPWQIKDKNLRDEVLFVCYLAWIRVAALLSPIIPSIASNLLTQLGIIRYFEQNGPNFEGLERWISVNQIRIPNKSFFINKLDLDQVKKCYKKLKLDQD